MIERSRLQLRERLRNFLGGLGIYQRAKVSWIYDFFWTVVDKQIVDDRQREVNFYLGLLDGFCEGDLVFDVGANQGHKSDIFLRLNAKVIAVEPDERCQKILRQRFLKYRLKRKSLTIIGKAVSDSDSIQTMWIDSPGSAKNTLSKKWAEALRSDDKRFGTRLSFDQWQQVETVSIEQLMSQHGLPLFVKIDVEGHELNVLRGMRRAVPYLSFEVNLPEFKEEGLECVRTLALLCRDGRFNYTPDCRRGLALKEWRGSDEFSALLSSCPDKSIEVFWKTPNLNR